MRLFLLIKVIFPVVKISFCSEQIAEAIETTTLPDYDSLDLNENATTLSSRSDQRIIGGHTAFITEYPYVVSIQHKGGSHTCGGTILAVRWILTAAHCLCEKKTIKRLAPKKFQVAVGLSMYDETQTVKGDIFYVSGVHAHENYSTEPVRHDIGLMKLSKSIQFSERARQVTLAMPEQYDYPHKYFADCEVCGWGRTSEKGNFTKQLQKVLLPLISNDDCNSVLGFETVNDWQMCTMFETGGKDACSGDSGGPIICNKTQVGIVSWGVGCGRPNMPGVYSKVAPYIEWLQNVRNSSDSLLISQFRLFIIFIFNIVILLTFCDFNLERGWWTNIL